MRTKLILIGVIIALLFTCFLSINSCSAQREKKLQWQNNTIALSSDIQTYIDKNGQLVSKAQGLELKNKRFRAY